MILIVYKQKLFKLFNWFKTKCLNFFNNFDNFDIASIILKYNDCINRIFCYYLYYKSFTEDLELL